MNISKKEEAISIPSMDELDIKGLMERYYSRVSRFAFAILKDKADAEDAAQETFIRAAVGLTNFRGESCVLTWLYAIALNVCRMELRKRKARQVLNIVLIGLLRVNGRSSSVEEGSVRRETASRLWEEVDHLDEKHRLPVILRYVERLTVPQIAQVLELREGTVHSRLHYARQKLAEKLGNELE